MALFLTESEIGGLLTMSDAIDAVDAAFRGAASANGTVNLPRARIFLPNGVLHSMAASLPDAGVLGTKTYTSFADGTRFYVQLFSTETGQLLAFMEADRLGQMRTGAATGVAARYLAADSVKTAALLGAGYQAETQAQALVTARPTLETFAVFSRSAERRAAFCEKMSAELERDFRPADSVEQAVEGAAVVVASTPAPTPILKGEWIAPGTFVAAVGANRLTAREIDETMVGRAAVTAVDDIAQAKAESAELIFAYEKRKWDWSRAVPLADIAAGRSPGRTSAEQITLFKSLGVALEDVAVAAVVYRKALASGIGRRF